MGLFDVFSKGGKYFGKAIEPKCEYCEHGNRTKEGNKVLCPKKGMVDAGYHCPKFLYSPLKRIPVKQLERVGWLEGDYEEKDFEQIKRQKEEDEKKAAEEAKKAMDAEIAKKAAEVVKEQAKTAAKTTPAPAPAEKPSQPAPAVTAPAPAPAAPQTSVRTPAAAPAVTRPTTPVPPDELASLAAMAESAGEYVPEPAEAKPEEPANDKSTLSSM